MLHHIGAWCLGYLSAEGTQFRVSENKVFGPKREEAVRNRRIKDTHNEEIPILYSPPNIRANKPCRMRQTKHPARMLKLRNAYTILV
jgi:hypothetical protein